MQVAATWSAMKFKPVQAFARPMAGTSKRYAMNHSIVTANRNTHVKIVVVALVAAIMVVSVGIAARLSTSGLELAGVNPSPVTAGVVKASKPVVWTDRGESTVR